MIVKVGSKWILYSKDGKVILGKHDTRPMRKSLFEVMREIPTEEHN